MHAHHHPHSPEEQTHAPAHSGGTVLTIRAHSGLSGDMFLAGLLRMTEADEADREALLTSIMPELAGTLHLVQKSVRGIGGWHAEVTLPQQHSHRTLADILALIHASGMQPAAKDRAAATFTLLAQAEAAVHGTLPEAVQFHEVGALDSILDICLTCALFTRLSPAQFIVSPLPMTDGWVRCAHGILPVPAPAVLELLDGIPVCPFSGTGETVTPSAIALLRGLGAAFGPWPAMRVEKKALVYGDTVFDDAPNGAIFAYGSGLTA